MIFDVKYRPLSGLLATVLYLDRNYVVQYVPG